MKTYTEDGMLVLADISGFTAFVTATELEHGPPIIAELLREVMQRLSPPLEIQEVEGDAVFAVGPDRAVGPPAVMLAALDDASRWQFTPVAAVVPAHGESQARCQSPWAGTSREIGDRPKRR